MAELARDLLKKSGGLLRQGVDLKFGFMAKHRSTEAPNSLAFGDDVRGAQCVPQLLLWLASRGRQPV